jgi:Tfp pilus assembly protein FimT
MSTVTEMQPRRERSALYIGAVVLLVILTVLGLILFSSARSSAKANDRADQLISELEQAGATPPSREQIVRVLGDDGGATCADPNAALKRGVLLSQLSNGAANVGLRPVIADSRVVQGQLLIIKTYCPDELPRFQEFVDSMQFEDVAGGQS